MESQWLSGRMPVSRSREPGLESPPYTLAPLKATRCVGVTPRQNKVLVLAINCDLFLFMYFINKQYANGEELLSIDFL